ncbi:hypothetical protein BHF71_04260 [Vulcanibacillus modesticaldus]|uniref:Uncharacterized protein n=1 Tax=Vulcanibacillus modesticaldus TaxID=337097 RepID=A0A1D2YSB6_9BACI|nr:hypothetical protein [Vulcanibacillus modesticaldus]OEF96949.1 hypothetical protein BHF71_04260 [Vulcanibacillus modesticaldus]
MDKGLAIELEKQFCTLKNVHSAHVDLDEQGEVLAIGIFSDGSRHPKEIKRDVEETFRQIAGFRINHTKISIVEQQFERGILSDDKRIRFLTAYQVQKMNGVIEGFVQLEYNEETIVESVEAHQFEMELEYIIANATARALMKVAKDYSIRIDRVKEVSMGQVDVIVVTASVIHQPSGAGHMFVGSVVKTKDLLSSVAKATLDALNRRIDQMI